MRIPTHSHKKKHSRWMALQQSIEVVVVVVVEMSPLMQNI